MVFVITDDSGQTGVLYTTSDVVINGKTYKTEAELEKAIENATCIKYALTKGDIAVISFTPVMIKSVNQTVESGKTNTEVEFYCAKQAGKLIAAVYDSKDCLVEIKSANLTVDATSATVTLDVDTSNGDYTTRVFVFDADGITPIAENF